MTAVFLRKAFAFIAKGVIEKEQRSQSAPTRYPYSKIFQHGMNMFLAASYQAGNAQYFDESHFLAQFITKPISDWFSGWDQDVIEKLNLAEEPFYGYGAFAYRRDENVYIPSSECYEFLETQDSDIVEGLDERALYEKMIVLDQDVYCRLRRYIIEHPIISIEDMREMFLKLSNPAAAEALRSAYEEIKEECYRCPRCGWTMTKGKYGYNCHSSHCTDTTPVLTDEMRLNVSDKKLYRLKKGVMRYFSAPGKLELDIVNFCEKKNIQWVLWPYKDKYDAEIRFSDGEIWEIDAKAYRNPITLRAKIQNDNGFPKGEYTRGYFVVPSEYTANQQNYTSIVNRALTNQKNVKCVTLKTLKTEIARKERTCHEK